MINGFEFNGKHSYNDFGYSLKSRDIGIAKKKKVKDSMPYVNGEYDFSDLYAQAYEERELKYILNIDSKSKSEMNIKKIELLNWLVVPGKCVLKDDTIPGYFFVCEFDESSIEELNRMGELSITAIAYPFKCKNSFEGNSLWDDFCFITDILQDTSFDIKGYERISLYNNGSNQKLSVTVEASDDFKLIKKDKIFYINKGTTKDYKFYLDIGKNDIDIIGNGKIEFKFRIEVL